MTDRLVAAAIVVVCAFLLGACDVRPSVTLPGSGVTHERLSEWGVIKRDGNRLKLGANVQPYDLNTPLFSDYALKLRTLWLPDGATASYQDNHNIELPVGAVLSKTFFYFSGSEFADSEFADAPSTSGIPVQLVRAWDGSVNDLDLNNVVLLETRLLVHEPDGWQAYPYRWRGDDAYLHITGDLISLTHSEGEFYYQIPSRNECTNCHATDHANGKLQPIGMRTRHLNRDYAQTAPDYPGPAHNQLTQFRNKGWLDRLPDDVASLPRNADWHFAADGWVERDSGRQLDHIVRSYLDANCGHCHSRTGAADTSGLLLDYEPHTERELGVCKPPVAAGKGTGGRRFSIVPGAADASILVYRMQTIDPSERMPEIGRALAHTEAISLVSDWVGAFVGGCE